MAFLSDLYWLAHQTESERQLAHDTVFFQRKTSPLLRRWTHQTFPDIFFFSPDCPSLSLSDGSLSLNRQFCSVCSACIYGAKNFHYNDQVMNILLLFKRKTHRLRLPLRWAPKREARPPAALISASVGILWEPKTTKHFDIVHTRLLIDSIPVKNRKFYFFGFFFFLLQNELARVKSSKGREIELLSWETMTPCVDGWRDQWSARTNGGKWPDEQATASCAVETNKKSKKPKNNNSNNWTKFPHYGRRMQLQLLLAVN